MSMELVGAMQVKSIGDPSAIDLAAEANHRIANSLALIAGLVRMQGAAICDTRVMHGRDVQLMLEQFGGRLETVARLHRLLAHPRQGLAIDLADHLREISDATASALSFAGQSELRLETEPSCVVTPHVALLMGLIVAELVTNSLKYAHPSGVAGVITISCRQCPTGTGPAGTIIVVVSDDGVGLPEGMDPRTSSQLGLRLVRSLADELRANISFDDRALGLSVTLQMPAGLSESNHGR